MKFPDSIGLEQRTFPPDAVIFSEGQMKGPAYIVKTGKVEISKSVNNHKVVLTTLGPNCIFGETSFIDVLPRSATATAVEATICFLVPEELLMENFENAGDFIKMLMRLMVTSLRDTSNQMVELIARNQAATEAENLQKKTGN